MQNAGQPAAGERFRKRLTQNDVEKVNFSSEDGGGQFWLDLVDSTGKQWVFLGSFVVSNALEKGLPVGPIGWPQFVREKALKPGDEVVLVANSTLDGNEQAPCKMFDVEVKRKIRLLGQDIWVAVI